MPFLARAAALGALATLAAVAPAAASAADAFTPLPVRTLTAQAASTTSAPCQVLATTGTRGVWQTRFAAPAEGFGSIRIGGGAAAGDWDLALFDAASGRALGSSLAFGADEVTQRWLHAGASVVVQACRRAGAAARVPASIAYGLSAWPKAEPAIKLVRIPLTDTRRQVPLLMALGVDVEEGVTRDAAIATVTAAQVDRLRRAGFAVRVLSGDVVAADRRVLVRDQAARTRAAGPRAATPGVPSGRMTYRRYPEYQADLKKLVAEHPGLVRAVTLPVRTIQGRDQMGVELSSAVNATDDQRPVSVIMGVHHAREWPAGELPLEFATYLAQEYGRDARVTKLLDTTRVFVVPVINPDGFISSRDAIDPADLLGDPAGVPSLIESVGTGGSLAYRRKNCRGAIPSPNAPCELQLGVDPNRNYGFNWGGRGASTSPNSQSYRGTGQWSEPETQSVHQFSQTHDVTSLITTHTFASLILRPPSVRGDGLAPDEARLKELGDAMASDTGYISQYGYELYDTSGTTEDWNYGAAGTYGYTIELGPTGENGGNFHVSYQQAVIDQWNGTGDHAGRGMRSAYLRAAEAATSKADFSTLKGKAPAGRTLRLKKTFKTFTAPICSIAGPIDLDPIDIVNGLSGGQTPNPLDCVNPKAPTSVDDHLEYTTTVGQSGAFDWLVTPSTQPFDYKKGLRQSWTLTCEDASGQVYDTRAIEIWRGQSAALDLPCGRPPAKGKDRLRPQSRFATKGRRTTRAGIYLTGSSRDLAPKALRPRLKSVAVSLGRFVDSRRCRFATASGRFGPAVACTRTSYLRAKGTTKWSFVFNHRLPKGRYFAWVRGVDAAGNVERKQRSRNLVRFTIR